MPSICSSVFMLFFFLFLVTVITSVLSILIFISFSHAEFVLVVVLLLVLWLLGKLGEPFAVHQPGHLDQKPLNHHKLTIASKICQCPQSISQFCCVINLSVSPVNFSLLSYLVQSFSKACKESSLSHHHSLQKLTTVMIKKCKINVKNNTWSQQWHSLHWCQWNF